jgi:Tfp pilus assembly protein PilV
MRVPRVRITLRRAMIAMAVVAILLGVNPLRQRSAQYHLAAMVHANAAEQSKKTAEACRAEGREHPETSPFREHDTREWERVAVWHAAVAKMYGRAASRPWETLPKHPLMLTPPCAPEEVRR